MSRRVFTVHVGTALEDVEQQLAQNQVSGLVVMSDDGLPIGVVTRTDLLRVAHVRPGHDRGETLTFDLHLSARDAMHADPVSVDVGATMEEAARVMAKRAVHRLMVVDGIEPVGILSVTDMLAAVADSEVATPIVELASESIACVAAEDHVAYAIDRLRASGLRGLVVLDGDWPAGAFTQLEALAAQDAGPDAIVGHWMSPAIVCAGPRTPVHRAAAQAVAMHAPLIVVVDGDRPTGVLSATDMLYAVL